MSAGPISNVRGKWGSRAPAPTRAKRTARKKHRGFLLGVCVWGGAAAREADSDRLRTLEDSTDCI